MTTEDQPTDETPVVEYAWQMVQRVNADGLTYDWAIVAQFAELPSLLQATLLQTVRRLREQDDSTLDRYLDAASTLQAAAYGEHPQVDLSGTVDMISAFRTIVTGVQFERKHP